MFARYKPRAYRATFLPKNLRKSRFLYTFALEKLGKMSKMGLKHLGKMSKLR